jgi:hypothetical protein
VHRGVRGTSHFLSQRGAHSRHATNSSARLARSGASFRGVASETPTWARTVGRLPGRQLDCRRTLRRESRAIVRDRGGRNRCRAIRDKAGSGTPAKFFTDCYTIRSNLVHGQLPRPTFETINGVVGELERFTRDLLVGDLIAAVEDPA